MLALRTFQRRFLTGALRRGVDTAALSLPRGNGKSALAGYLVARVLDPADPLFRPGTESVLCAASIEQARIVFRFAGRWSSRGAGIGSWTRTRGSGSRTGRRTRAYG